MAGPLETIDERNRLLADAERALHEGVEQAREAGHTWQEVADVLGVSRQAAFKRFGQVSDPVTGERLAPAPTADVALLAARVLELLAQGGVEELRTMMTQACARELTARRIQATWADALGEYGSVTEAGRPSAHALDGTPLEADEVPLPAVGRVEAEHEAGRTRLHVVVNRSGRVTGLVLRPVEVPETWPL